jgi:hypothetical protein
MIGVVKTATRNYPMKYLSNIVLHNRGDKHGVVAKDADGNVEMLAFVWMDRERRYFIGSGSSVPDGTRVVRERWRQVVAGDGLPTKLKLTIPPPRACELYYGTCAKVDRHNRDRHYKLGIKNKLVTMDCSLRVNLSILSMCIVDTWKLFSEL